MSKKIVKVVAVVNEQGEPVVQLIVDDVLVLGMSSMAARVLAGGMVNASARNRTAGVHEIMRERMESLAYGGVDATANEEVRP